MRNLVKVINKDVPKLTVSSLKAGQMFRYPNNSKDNIYMVLGRHGDDTPYGGVVHLATGATYVGFNAEAEIQVVDAVEISR